VWTRRRFLLKSGLTLLGTGGVALALSTDAPPDAGESRDALPDGSASKDMITPRADQAIDRGLAWLHANRLRNGAFGAGIHGYQSNVAVTSLAGLAFLAAGNQPNRGPYGRTILDALRFLLSLEKSQDHKGFLYNPVGGQHGPMYSHGFGTLFLAEVSGMVYDKALREEVNERLHRAVDLILASQNKDGGWRYEPNSTDADISVTICQIMALRAARNAGIAVPKSKVDKCVEYVKACQDRREGFFRYQKQGGFAGSDRGFARTAAGVVALNSAGVYTGREVEDGLKYLLRTKPTVIAASVPDMHYFYGQYYAVQAMWTAGGEYWKAWFPGVRDDLLALQRPAGSWEDAVDTHYATAMACIILQVPNNYLPILQK
jgi:hypothetical protein